VNLWGPTPGRGPVSVAGHPARNPALRVGPCREGKHMPMRHYLNTEENTMTTQKSRPTDGAELVNRSCNVSMPALRGNGSCSRMRSIGTSPVPPTGPGGHRCRRAEVPAFFTTWSRRASPGESDPGKDPHRPVTRGGVRHLPSQFGKTGRRFDNPERCYLKVSHGEIVRMHWPSTRPMVHQTRPRTAPPPGKRTPYIPRSEESARG